MSENFYIRTLILLQRFSSGVLYEIFGGEMIFGFKKNQIVCKIQANRNTFKMTGDSK